MSTKSEDFVARRWISLRLKVKYLYKMATWTPVSWLTQRPSSPLFFVISWCLQTTNSATLWLQHANYNHFGQFWYNLTRFFYWWKHELTLCKTAPFWKSQLCHHGNQWITELSRHPVPLLQSFVVVVWIFSPVGRWWRHILQFPRDPRFLTFDPPLLTGGTKSLQRLALQRIWIEKLKFLRLTQIGSKWTMWRQKIIFWPSVSLTFDLTALNI